MRRDTAHTWKASLAPVLFAIGLSAGLGACGGGEETSGASEQAVRSVKLGRATARTFRETVRLQGSLSAKHKALVGPQIPGTLSEVLVSEGDAVVAGETRLFSTDARKLRIAADTARLNVALAAAGIREARARKAQVQIAADKAAVDYERHKALHAKDAISTDIMEKIELGYKQTQAQLEHIAIVVELAEQKKRQADLGLRVNLQNLADSTVEAPISGVIAARMQEPGEMAAPGRPVVRIEDPSVLEASSFLPASYYARVKAGRTRVRLSTYGVDLGEQPVSYKSPTISRGNRTFEIRCEIHDPPEGAASGGMVEMQVQLGEAEVLAVPIAAVVKRGGQDRIFLVKDGRAQSIGVTAGSKDEGWLAVQAEGLAPDTPVVVVGQAMLDDGDAVQPVGQQPARSGKTKPLLVSPASPETLQVQVPGEAG